MAGDLYDEAALIGAVGSFITGMVVLWRQGRHRRETARNAETLDAITDTLNHTDQAISTQDGPQTLGQRVVALQRTVEEGFAHNDATHDAIFDGLHQVGRRVDVIRSDLDVTRRRIEKLHQQGEATDAETE